MTETHTPNYEIKEITDSCEIVVCIPVAGHQEGHNIYRTLESYTNQTLSSDKFEINLFVNKPTQDPSGQPIEWDQTFDEIERFKNDYPDFKVVVETEEFGPGEFTIGKVRHNQSKRVIQRTVTRNQANHTDRDIILVSNDADNKGIAPTYLENFLTKFNENPNTPAFLGQIDWNPEEYAQHPLVHIGTRLFQYLNIQSRSNWIDSSGANFAIKGSAYSEIGGHNTDLAKGEDSELGERLKSIYGEDSIKFAGNRVSLVYTSARRAVDTVLKGKSPIEQWDDEFGAFDDDVRKIDQSETSHIDFEDKESIQAFIKRVELVINRTIQKVLDFNAPWEMTAEHKIFKRALKWLGIDEYEIIDQRKINIINADTLIKNIQAYQTEGRLVQASKTGDKEASAKLIIERKKSNRAEIRGALEGIHLNFNFAEQHPVTAEEIVNSRNSIRSENYVFSASENHVLSKNRSNEAQVMLGVNTNTGEVIVAKRRNKNYETALQERHGIQDAMGPEERIIGENFLGAPVCCVNVEDEGDFFIYKKGKSDLFEVLKSQTEFPVEQALKIIMQLLEDLRVLQTKDLLHADISPRNILFGHDQKASIIDVQSASMKNKSGEFNKDYVGGVQEIFPPELINLECPLSPSVDTYSLLSILYRLIKGRYPHQISGLNGLNLTKKQRDIIYSALHKEGEIDYSDIPPGLVKIMRRGLSSTQSERYNSAAELHNELGKFLLGHKTTVERSTIEKQAT